MYPRNAASPERVAVGPVVQISDGAVQTSGVSIAVRGQGGASGAGSGTTAYDNGIVEYTPTQGETDFTSFVVIAYKTGCIPVSQTIVTSASATAGYAGTDQGKIANATSTVNLSGTTVKTATDVEADTADIQTRLPAALTGDGNIKADTLRVGGTVQTAGDIPAMITTVDDYVDTEVAAIKAKTDNLPAAPAAVSDIPSAATVAAAVWAYTVEGAYTAVQYLRIAVAALAGKLSGAATTTVSIRDTGDTKNRVVATVDADGNRSAVTLDGA